MRRAWLTAYLAVMVFGACREKPASAEHVDKAIFDGQLLRFSMNEVLETEDARRRFSQDPAGWIADNPSDGEMFKLLKEHGRLIVGTAADDTDSLVVVHIANGGDDMQVWENGKVTVYSN